MPWFVEADESAGSRWRSALINNQSKMFSKAWAIWEWTGKQTITAGAGSHVYFPIENTVGGKFQSLIYQTTALHKKSSSGGDGRARGSEEKVPEIQHQWFIMNKQLQPAPRETQSQVKKGPKPFLFFPREFFTPLLLAAAAVTASAGVKSVRNH